MNDIDPTLRTCAEIFHKTVLLAASGCPCGGKPTVYPRADLPYTVTEHTTECPLSTEEEPA